MFSKQGSYPAVNPKPSRKGVSTKFDAPCARCGNRRGRHDDAPGLPLASVGCPGFKKMSAK